MATREHKGGRCPRCGSTLLTNGAFVWCSFVGDGRAVRPCVYGIDVAVLATSAPGPDCRECQDWGCEACLPDAEATVSADTQG